MADNVTSDPGTGGASWVTAEISWSGDTVHASGGFLGLLAGSEGAWTYSSLLGGAGAVAAGVLRTTLASDDPAVVSLQLLDNAIAGNELQVDVVTLPAVTNAGTFAVQAAQAGTWNVTNVSGTVSLPTGAATAANQTTIIGHVDGIETLLGTIDGDTGTLAATDFMLGTDFSTVLGTASLITATQADDIANTTDGLNTTSFAYVFDGTTWDRLRGTSTDGVLVNLGTNNDVTVTGTAAVTQSGTWTVQPGNTPNTSPWLASIHDGTTKATVRELGTNDALNVALTDGSGNHITSFGGGTEYTEDAAAAADPVGKATILVRADTPGAVATTNGDNVAQRGTNYGAAYVTLLKSDGTEAAYIDANIGDAASATEAGIPVLAIRDDSLSALADAEGDWVGLRVNSTGALHVTGGGGGTEYAVDTALGATPTGSLAIAIRDDALAALTPVEGDAIGLRVDANGALWVIPSGTITVASHAVTNAGTFAVQAAQSGTWNVTNVSGTVSLPTGASTSANQTTIIGHLDGVEGLLTTIDTDTGNIVTAVELLDDTVATLGTTTYTEATTKGLVIGAVRRDADTTLAGTTNEVAPLQVDANGYLKVEIFDGGGSHTVDGTVAATQSGTWNVTNVSGTVSLPTGASTLAEQQTQTTALALLDNTIVAHDNAVSGSTGVSIIGFEARSTEPTAVASADATRAMATLLGKQVVLPFAIPASSWLYASPAAVTDTADDVAIAAGTGAERRYVTGVQVFNGHDTVGTEVVIKDGTTVIWRGWAEQTGGGCSAAFSPPLRGTAATAVNVANITTGSSTYFNLQGYTAAE